MNNHYHLLIELHKENLSRFMRYLNGTYAIYFNKKYQRSGHLWQGRFKSWYVTNEAYLFTLIRYIEYNPIKAKIVDKLEYYPYSSYQYFFKQVPEYLQESWLYKNYKDDINSIKRFFESEISTEDLNELQKASSLVETNGIKKELDDEYLIHIFKDIKEINKRNLIIIDVINEGYSQHRIAKVLNISQTAVYKIVKKSNR